MAVTINGNGTITGYTPTAVSGTLTASNMPSGSIIQTVIGASDNTNASSVDITSSTATSPTFFNSACNVALTPQFSDSKILITFTAQIRLNPDAEGYVGIYYSPNSNMSSPTVVEKSHGPNNNLNESYRTVQNDHYMFHSWSRMCWDETITNTNIRYYGVAGWAAAGTMVYGDNGLALQLMAQEIAA